MIFGGLVFLTVFAMLIIVVYRRAKRSVIILDEDERGEVVAMTYRGGTKAASHSKFSTVMVGDHTNADTTGMRAELGTGKTIHDFSRGGANSIAAQSDLGQGAVYCMLPCCGETEEEMSRTLGNFSPQNIPPGESLRRRLELFVFVDRQDPDAPPSPVLRLPPRPPPPPLLVFTWCPLRL